MRQASGNLGEVPALVQLALNHFRADLDQRVQRRRFLSLLRRVLAGHTNSEIAEALSLHRNTVSRLLRNARDIALERGLSLSELERSLTAERVREIRAISDRRNVVDWRDVQKALGRDK